MLESDTIHLEWQDLPEIDNLELFSNIRSLYLQYNSIPKIENLEFLTSLEFLSLEGNKITYVSGLSTLFNLLYLNLANNQIRVLDCGQIPQGVAILKVGGNPCSEDISYRIEVIKQLPMVEELDDIPVLEEKMRLMGVRYRLYRVPTSLPEDRSDSFDGTRPSTEYSVQGENLRYMTEDEEVQFCQITETTWEMVLKSRKRLEDLQKTRESFRIPLKK